MGAIANDDEVLLELGLATTATPEERAVVVASVQAAEGAVRRYLKYDPVWKSHTEFYPMHVVGAGASDAVWESTLTAAVLRRESSSRADELQLRHIPIRSITSLNEDLNAYAGSVAGSFGAGTALTEGTDFWPNYDSVDLEGDSLCSDGIIRGIRGWPTSPGTLKVVYVAGYTDEEFRGNGVNVDAVPILTAVVAESVRKAKKVFVNQKQTGAGWAAGPMTSEGLGDYNYVVDSSLAARLFGSSWDLMPESKEALSDYVNWGWMLIG